uniref:K Homology domain-containing protein n=1 Tax=Globodera rostochiensis TaxID=31243 RepID=A0A914GTS9_GLORO
MTTEQLIIPTEMANKIINEVDQNCFERWKQNGCTLEKQKYSVQLVLNGIAIDNELLLSEEIFPVLKQTQDSLLDRYVLALKLLVPNQKCGYVIGKEGKTIRKIQEDFGVEIFIDNGKRDPVPTGFGRLIIRTADVDAMRWARDQIRRLEARSLDFNPYAMPRDNNNHLGEDKRATSERIKLPPFGHFTNEQQMHFREIQKSSSINWIFDEQHSLTDASGRFVTLEGDTEMVLSAKRRLAKLITEIEDFQLHCSSVRLSTSPTSGTTLYRTVVKVPTPAWRLVIGAGGKTIKALKERYEVSMRFLGDNYVAYPHFRSLSIRGPNQLNVQSVRAYIEREFVAKNSDFVLENNIVTAKPNVRRTFIFEDPNNNNKKNTDVANSKGHKAPISGWESDDDSWAAEDTHVCSDFGAEEQRDDDGSEETAQNSEDETLPKWDEEEEREGEQHVGHGGHDDGDDVAAAAAENKLERNGGAESVLERGDGQQTTLQGGDVKSTGNEESGLVDRGEEDELFLLIERKEEEKEIGAGRKVGQRVGGEHRNIAAAAVPILRRMTSLSDGIGNSCVSAASSGDSDIDEPLSRQRHLFQPLDRNMLACQLERAKATLLGDEQLARELARTQALLRSKERECEQLRAELQRLKQFST